MRFGSKVPLRSFAATPLSPRENEEEKSKPTPSSIMPGLGLSAATAFGGFQTASIVSSAVGIPLSGIPISILFGMTIKNSIGYSDETFKPGITFATKTVLQTGIVCVAAKLSFGEVVATSASSIPVVFSAVAAGLLFLPAAGKFAGLPRQMSLLLTAGTSICGVTAITALAPAIQAPPRDIAVAVANTVLFGTVGMLAYPYVFHYLCDGDSTKIGMCLGVAIHDTSQVLGSALSYKETWNDEVAFQVAAVTKLLRNMGLAIAIPSLSYSYAVSQEGSRGSSKGKDDDNEEASTGKEPETMSGLATFTKKYVPPFLIAFLGMSTLRSGGDFALAETAANTYFSSTMDFIGNDLSKCFLGTAMAGVGLSTAASSLKGVGWKPFAVGGAGALVVGSTGFAVASMMF